MMLYQLITSCTTTLELRKLGILHHAVYSQKILNYITRGRSYMENDKSMDIIKSEARS